MDWVNKLELTEIKVKVINMILNKEDGHYEEHPAQLKEDLIKLVAIIEANEPTVPK
ncbi:hypothetical protein [Sutcliffiella sp. NC1]|uniref:hypothetical protein n=1 Tax=Sutcliffiella sp. NC1 TaxID=3004096 RepID=UPI0022DD06AC|nr:hypothetical protein [Sutcliffiella sp. NC1]WBL16429.1 hypothetical protein O1A01_07285 [Sutcliffiella sp. NC1]